ncbi:unnamed protein product [Lactuca virosa]|uniref:Uncharacterized protein n=1 Tax=Lactuca virosa TaxID=75947 RepID=A0AAU9PMD4_9ASTR|nr:unnamed protein product [Lactuca virosa]
MVSSCVLFGYFAETASRARRQQPVSRPDFPWYSFPRTVRPEIYARWNVKLDWMKQRKVHVPAVVDWHWIGQTRLMEGLEPYLDKAFNSIHGQFVCMGWRRLFEIQEVVYKELVVEFLATVSFTRKYGREFIFQPRHILKLINNILLDTFGLPRGSKRKHIGIKL